MSAVVVTAPLVLVRNAAGGFDYLYQGAVLPEDTSPEEVARLTEDNLVAPVGTPLPPDASKMTSRGHVK